MLLIMQVVGGGLTSFFLLTESNDFFFLLTESNDSSNSCNLKGISHRWTKKVAVTLNGLL